MNQPLIDKIVEAVLYEGYNLYPYRPAVKSHCRWNFGGLYPRAYSEAGEGADRWQLQMQCLVKGETTKVDASVRFLHLVQRTIGVLPAPCGELPPDNDLAYEEVDSFELGGARYQSWQEAVERRVDIGPLDLPLLAEQGAIQSFSIPGHRSLDPIRRADGRIVAVMVRQSEALIGTAEIAAEWISANVHRLTVRVLNQTAFEPTEDSLRDEALQHSLVATHIVASATAGRFLSLIDPPPEFHTATAVCENQGVWPVLVGAAGQHDAMLASPIILYDYPQIAPQSPGSLFDGTEIDEILTLRVMTLTDEEKRQAAAVDDRTRQLMERTETLAREELAGLHGAMNRLEPSAAELFDSGWDPLAERPAVESIQIDGVDLRRGDRVRLRPGLGGDILDIALAGKTATIASIEQDFDDRFHVAVTIDDDPGQDLGLLRQPGHRFFFKPEELAPLETAEARS